MKHTKNDRHAELAFTLAEKGKAILLMSRIKENESKLIYDIPEGSQTKADSLRKKINALSTQISLTNISSSDQTNKQSGDRKKLLSTQQKYYEVISQIQVDYPGYNSRILDFQVDLSKIQSSLSTNTALIEYVVAKEYIYLFYVTADQLELKVLENPIELEQYAAEFINAILTRNIEDYADRAYKLYDHLIKPYDQLLSKAKIDYLTIVSDGFLSYLPFEAFLKSSPNKLDYKSFDYLMRHFNISYDYSASLKIQLAKQKLSDRSNVLAFAPTFSGKSSNIATRNASTMSELPYAQQEAENVVAQFNGVRYTGDMATETTFKKEAHNYQILHLATHALADDQQPNLSRLFFADNDTLNDGLLYAHELYNMDLNAKLVTLSACNTGTGKFYKGEGIASLARAFRYAGCQNVIMSLWAVADQSTSDIMDEFYSQSVQGLPMSDALHAAKLHYLENADGNTADPFYWAGFTLIGQNKPLKQSSVNLEIVISIISLFVIVLILIGIRKKKKRNLNIEKG